MNDVLHIIWSTLPSDLITVHLLGSRHQISGYYVSYSLEPIESHLSTKWNTVHIYPDLDTTTRTIRCFTPPGRRGASPRLNIWPSATIWRRHVREDNSMQHPLEKEHQMRRLWTNRSADWRLTPTRQVHLERTDDLLRKRLSPSESQNWGNSEAVDPWQRTGKTVLSPSAKRKPLH